MIDLENKITSHIKRVKDYIAERVATYYASDCYKKLRGRVSRLDDSIDMKFGVRGSRNRAVNAWKSKIAMPLVREAFLARRAVTLASFRQDPIVTVDSVKNTPAANAEIVQNLLVQNFKSTKFRQKAFRQTVNLAARYGTSVMCHNFVRSTQKYKARAKTKFGFERVWMAEPKNNAMNYTVHPFNYFQDPSRADSDDAGYRGYIERRRLSELITWAQTAPDLYIADELKKAIAEAKKSAGSMHGEHYYDNTGAKDYDSVGVDVTHWYGKVNIKGNEDSETCYYAVMVGEYLIRFQENPHDYNLVPITTYNYDQRPNYWWGNIDSENVLPHEQYMQMAMSMAADEGLRNLEKYIFYDAAAIDPADLNNRHKNGGYVPINPGNRNARDIFYQYQNVNTNALGGIQYVMQEMKESAQRVRPKADLTRQGLPGGPRNDTATAAIMLDEQGDMLESDLLESFAYGLVDTAAANVVLMQQNLPQQFQLRPDPRMPAFDVGLDQVLGEYGYKYSSSLTKNKMVQAQNLMNTLTFMQNMRGTGDPSWMNVNMPAYVRKWLNHLDLGVDVDEGYPQMQQQPQMMQGAPQMNMPGAGGPVGQQMPPEMAQQEQLPGVMGDA